MRGSLAAGEAARMGQPAHIRPRSSRRRLIGQVKQPRSAWQTATDLENEAGHDGPQDEQEAEEDLAVRAGEGSYPTAGSPLGRHRRSQEDHQHQASSTDRNRELDWLLERDGEELHPSLRNGRLATADG